MKRNKNLLGEDNRNINKINLPQVDVKEKKLTQGKANRKNELKSNYFGKRKQKYRLKK